VNYQTHGFTNVVAARFCSGCGQALGACRSAEVKAQRSHVCVPLCELVGPTPQFRQLDTQAARIVMS
jgi:hypothetical protein